MRRGSKKQKALFREIESFFINFKHFFVYACPKIASRSSFSISSKKNKIQNKKSNSGIEGFFCRSLVYLSCQDNFLKK